MPQAHAVPITTSSSTLGDRLLLATELLAFAVKGSIPFRWGIQCKFSKGGTEGSVRDDDFRDVEGILRSSRFASQGLQGYMLVTNRKVVQNVIERLQGIDKASQFRTAVMDGLRLPKAIEIHEIIRAKYFNESGMGSEELGVPGYVSELNLAGRGPTIPLTNLFGGQERRLDATIDSGANLTVLPKEIAEDLGIPPQSRVVLSA